jgi:broad specificity phosphatase PhoE
VGTIFLVRHGQAAFGTDDYDRLTPTGFQQSRLLGQHLAARGIAVDAVITGTLRRQVETAEAILEGIGAAQPRPDPVIERKAGLNEYDPRALVFALTGAHPPDDERAARRDPEVVRSHFRLLREALLAWAEGRTSPAGMPDWAGFQSAAEDAIVWSRERFPEGNVLVVSSGGPIAAIVCAALLAPPKTAVELNLRIRNTALTEFATNARRHHLVSFNAIPHLEQSGEAGLATYA